MDLSGIPHGGTCHRSKSFPCGRYLLVVLLNIAQTERPIGATAKEVLIVVQVLDELRSGKGKLQKRDVCRVFAVEIHCGLESG
jgi:hypothetical protein